MWMDVIVALIFVLATADGLRQGFVKTVIQTLGWLVALGAGLVFQGVFHTFLVEKTNIVQGIEDRIMLKITTGEVTSENFFVSKMPVIVHDFVANGLTPFLVKLIAFILVVFFFRLIFLLIIFVFSKKKRRGLIGFFDGFLGIFAGMLKGFFLIFLFLAILIPFIGLFPMGFISDALEGSTIAGVLYDNNYLLLAAKMIR